MNPTVQSFSHYPTWPMPVEVPATLDAEHPCSYLPGRIARMRAFLTDRMPPHVYQQFMDAGFRRSGNMIYQPMCRACRECVPIRVLADRFHPSKSQRRCWRHNADLSVTIALPQATEEKYALYQRYVRDWHGDGMNDDSRAGFERFLYDSPLNSVEFAYRDQSGRLLAVGICDLCDDSLSSVYYYFDPCDSRRVLGTFGALNEIDYAKENGVPYYYLGYWIKGCRTMEYKSSFRPCEILGTDGQWRGTKVFAVNEES